MSNSKKQFMVVAGVLTIAVSIWNYGHMLNSRGNMNASIDDYFLVAKISAGIKSLNNQPKIASQDKRQDTETTSLIEKAAKTSEISPSSIVRISPQLPQRVEKSDYKEQSTSVILEKITLEQLVGMLYRLAANDTPLKTKSLHLRTPRDAKSGDLWDIEVVLAYLIYEPMKNEKIGVVK